MSGTLSHLQTCCWQAQVCCCMLWDASATPDASAPGHAMSTDRERCGQAAPCCMPRAPRARRPSSGALLPGSGWRSSSPPAPAQMQHGSTSSAGMIGSLGFPARRKTYARQLKFSDLRCQASPSVLMHAACSNTPRGASLENVMHTVTQDVCIKPSQNSLPGTAIRHTCSDAASALARLL